MSGFGSLSIAVGLLCASCSSDRAYTEFRSELTMLQQRTQPSGGRMIMAGGPATQHGSVRASWEIESGMTWDVYRLWLIKELAADWKTPSSDSHIDEASFLKSFGGEIRVLEARSGGRGSRVLLSFTVIPD